ncbi:hypothetical protein CRE_11169 [Caenorhabditis remanei]|uniref:Sdz-33 F-box domain-containing protein n=1 Tax=Caenorhabditis remanei TaxID=31234 RepID=E3MQ46_CAERE|nr:hypothetical protein CRE_11169 [Caenorhabditis remanei]
MSSLGGSLRGSHVREYANRGGCRETREGERGRDEDRRETCEIKMVLSVPPYFSIVTEFVKIISKLSDHFNFPQFNHLNQCSLDFANWLTFDQLLQFKGARFCIHGSSLTNHELNQFLIFWMSSQCHQNLSFLRININDPESSDTILDLPYEIMNSNVERIGILPNNTAISLKGGIDIKRNDWMTGTIKGGLN